MSEESKNDYELEHGFKDYYESYKSFPGTTKEEALEKAFLWLCKTEFWKQCDMGRIVSDAEKNIAIINATEHIALLYWRIGNLKKIHSSIKITNFLLFLIILLFVASFIK